jgi:hypothetical protein
VEAQELLAEDKGEELEVGSLPESAVVNMAAVDLQALSIEEQQHSKNHE